MKYNVAVTAILKNLDNQVLIVKRSMTKDKWPGKWTLPGGRVENSDFLGTPTEINNQWYNILENAAIREVKEETGYDVKDMEYLCSIAVPGTIIVSMVAGSVNGKLKLQESECSDYAWVSAKEAEKYDLIDGILAEIRNALVEQK